MHPYTDPEVGKAEYLLHQANVLIQKIWLNQMVFTWRWWFLEKVKDLVDVLTDYSVGSSHLKNS